MRSPFGRVGNSRDNGQASTLANIQISASLVAFSNARFVDPYGYAEYRTIVQQTSQSGFVDSALRISVNPDAATPFDINISGAAGALVRGDFSSASSAIAMDDCGSALTLLDGTRLADAGVDYVCAPSQVPVSEPMIAGLFGLGLLVLGGRSVRRRRSH